MNSWPGVTPLVAFGVIVTLASGCGPSAPERTVPPPGAATSADPTLVPPVSLPDLSHMSDAVRNQIEERFAATTGTIDNPNATAIERSVAYGEMGKLLMAAGCFEAAAPFFLHAQALAPSESRWPYYLGHVHKTNGASARSAEFFERALSLNKNDTATLMRLADAYLTLGRPELAEPLAAKALELDPRSAPARFRLGRAALARQDYAGARNHFEEGLKLDPRAAAIHYPLGLAYRELGDQAMAEAHLRQRYDGDVPVSDPLMGELGELLNSSATYESRGIAALDRGEWPAAAALFRKGLELAPADPSLHHRLGTALFLSGDHRAAVEEFERALRASPRFAKAHYSLGVLMETSGRASEAIGRFAAAVKADPSYTEARLRLASVLRRTGRAEEALAEYDRVLEIDPRIADARYLRGLILVRLGRYEAAREYLAAAAHVYPDRPAFAVALARLLAAAPDDRVRDGRRALELMEAVPAEQRSLEWGETMAMTFAELGRFDEAIGWQRRVIASVDQAGQKDLARRMTGNLRLYERRQPSRTPWPPDQMP